MATLALLIVLFVVALVTRQRILRGAGVLNSRSMPQRQRIARISDAVFAGLAIMLLIASIASGFTRVSNASSNAIPLALLGLVAIALPVLRDSLAYLVLKFDRRLRVDDVISCDRVRGRVQHLSLLRTTIRTLDACTVVVPNRYLLAHPYHRWNGDSGPSRIVMPIEASCLLDPANVKELLLECTRSATLIAPEPLPDVMFLGQRGDRLHFQLRVWILDRSLETEAISQLNYPITRCLRAASQSNRSRSDLAPNVPATTGPLGSMGSIHPASAQSQSSTTSATIEPISTQPASETVANRDSTGQTVPESESLITPPPPKGPPSPESST